MNPLRPFTRLLATPLGIALRGRRAGLERSIAERPELAQTGTATLTVTSTSFRGDNHIPLRHAGVWYGDNVSPQLAWTRPPVATKALLVVAEDVDAPTKDPIIHLAAVLDPDLRTVSEGELNRKSAAPGVRLLDAHGYQGPNALPGHGQHRYLFHLFALNIVPGGDTLSRVLETVSGHVIAHGTFTGVFPS